MERKIDSGHATYRVTDDVGNGKLLLEYQGYPATGPYAKPPKRLYVRYADACRLGEALIEVADHILKSEILKVKGEHDRPENPEPEPGEVWHVVLPDHDEGSAGRAWIHAITEHVVELVPADWDASSGRHVKRDTGWGKLYERSTVRFLESVQQAPRDES